MKDTELRGLVLQNFYEHRRERAYEPKRDDFGGGIPEEDIYAICSQLSEHGLITWNPVHMRVGVVGGMGKITASGIDVIEEGVKPPITIVLNHAPTISVNSSSNVQIGDSNSQTINTAVEQLFSVVDQSNGSQEQKEQAKSLLRAFLEHPLVCSIAGGLASSVQLK